MKTNHTHGPWCLKPDPCHFDTMTTVVAGSGEPNNRQMVVQVGGHAGVTESEANARLIASAPDMLEALRITRGNVASLGPAGALEPFAPYREWLSMLDRVITKATGDES